MGVRVNSAGFKMAGYLFIRQAKTNQGVIPDDGLSNRGGGGG